MLSFYVSCLFLHSTLVLGFFILRRRRLDTFYFGNYVKAMHAFIWKRKIISTIFFTISIRTPACTDYSLRSYIAVCFLFSNQRLLLCLITQITPHSHHRNVRSPSHHSNVHQLVVPGSSLAMQLRPTGYKHGTQLCHHKSHGHISKS